MAEVAESNLGGGNTNPPPKKRISPSKMWCFTLNNYTSEEMAVMADLFRGINCEWIIGKEVGEQGTPHLQGFVYFNAKGGTRPMEKVKNKRIHWEKCKGTKEQNIIYCKKEGNFIYGNKLMADWLKDIDIIKESKEYRVSLPKYNPWMGDILNIISKTPDYRHIYWYWEECGNTGKTEFQKYIFTNYDRVVILGGKSSDMKNGIVDYYSKNKYLPKIILINLPRSTSTYISYSGLEEVKDMMFYSGKYEGGMICGERPHMIIFANREPPEDKMSKDKFQVVEIINQSLTFKDELIDDQTDKCWVHCGLAS